MFCLIKKILVHQLSNNFMFRCQTYTSNYALLYIVGILEHYCKHIQIIILSISLIYIPMFLQKRNTLLWMHITIYSMPFATSCFDSKKTPNTYLIISYYIVSYQTHIPYSGRRYIYLLVLKAQYCLLLNYQQANCNESRIILKQKSIFANLNVG